MSKRKSVVNDIIYELDNDDIEVSSEDEIKGPKISRNELKKDIIMTDNSLSTDSLVEAIGIDVTDKGSCTNDKPNGEIMTSNKIKFEDNQNISLTNCAPLNNLSNHDKQTTTEFPNTVIFNEDIVIDSPISNSNSDLSVVGCENRSPLVSVRFKDNKLASAYRKEIKEFMLNLIKLHKHDAINESETDLVLDIWPEDLIKTDEAQDCLQDNIFFEDTAPCFNEPIEIPRYSQGSSTVITNTPSKETSPPPSLKRGPTCFNCDGSHQLRECKLPRNNARISERRKNMTRMGRYHIEDEQKYGHLIPGRISGQLRHALGLKRNELPLFIYQMRVLGYPPGWLEEARISHSGITMFDSTGSAIQEPDDEEGEVIEPGSKDKYDIKKILDFPGFNVEASSRYKEEAHLYGLPPMSPQDSKIAMLQTLAPNAMKAYKRKKLTFFPSASNDNPRPSGQIEMELDSGDEMAEFPSVPPLPDEAPPSPPPPPPPLPPPESSPQPPPHLEEETEQEKNKETKETLTSRSPEPIIPSSTDTKTKLEPHETETNKQTIDTAIDVEDSSDDLEVIEVTKVVDIPVPVIKPVVIDDNESGRESPTLDDLEEKKRILLSALENGNLSGDLLVLDTTGSTDIEASIDDTGQDIFEGENNMQGDLAISENQETNITIDETSNELENNTENICTSPIDNTKVEEDNCQTATFDNEDAENINNSQSNLNVTAENINNSQSNLNLTAENINNSQSNLNLTAENINDSQSNLNLAAENINNSQSNLNLAAENINNSQSNLNLTAENINNSQSNLNLAAKNINNSQSNLNLTAENINNSQDNLILTAPDSVAGAISIEIDSQKSVKLAGQVKTSSFGTPVLNIASSYVSLPSDDKFSKDICDVLNFENLPNSTGKYKRIAKLLKKVKNEVDRIQES